MSQNLEIEFKNMLTKAEYQLLIDFFKIRDNNIFAQENHYFDTPTFLLKENGSALRIRHKKGEFEMTLKQPYQDGLLETNQQISTEEADLAIKTGKLPYGAIKDLVSTMNIPFSEIEYFGSLITKRVEINYKNGLLVFDHSCYLNKEDYELEFEADDYKQGQQTFLQFLKEHKIPERNTENKIRRFYQEKYKQFKK